MSALRNLVNKFSCSIVADMPKAERVEKVKNTVLKAIDLSGLGDKLIITGDFAAQLLVQEKRFVIDEIHIMAKTQETINTYAETLKSIDKELKSAGVVSKIGRWEDSDFTDDYHVLYEVSGERVFEVRVRQSHGYWTDYYLINLDLPDGCITVNVSSVKFTKEYCKSMLRYEYCDFDAMYNFYHLIKKHGAEDIDNSKYVMETGKNARVLARKYPAAPCDMWYQLVEGRDYSIVNMDWIAWAHKEGIDITDADLRSVLELFEVAYGLSDIVQG